MLETTTLYMTVGIPGCGKSTWAREMEKYGVRVHSSDALRKELFGDENEQGEPWRVFEELGKRVIRDLKQGISCVYDATNMNRRKRMNFIQGLPGKIRKVCVLFLVPPQTCIRQDAGRSRSVGVEVIDRMLRSFHCPCIWEGWDEIRPVIREPLYRIPLEEMKDFSQDNIYHTLTLGAHMEAAADICKARGCSEEVQIAAAHHDCGKYFTKKFENARGLPSENAHYYGHEHYGTYLFLLDACLEGGGWKYGSLERTLYIAQLINAHMTLYGNRSRFTEIYPLKLRMELEQLHEADEAAH